MKSLIKRLFNSEKLIEIRNQLQVKPVDMLIINQNNNISVSDSFLWRTDNDFITKFKFTDLLNLFYDLNDSFVEIFFYKKCGEFIKSFILDDLKMNNDLIIDKYFMDGLSDYGSFNIFHFFNKKINNSLIISNRCYLGFSKGDSFFSYVHGNLLSKYKINNEEKIKSNIIKTSLFVSQEYAIQNNFSDFDRSELFFANPTSKKIIFYLVNTKYILMPKSCKIVNLDKTDKKITIKSNCMFLRPIIFNYKNNFFDVYHG